MDVFTGIDPRPLKSLFNYAPPPLQDVLFAQNHTLMDTAPLKVHPYEDVRRCLYDLILACKAMYLLMVLNQLGLTLTNAYSVITRRNLPFHIWRLVTSLVLNVFLLGIQVPSLWFIVLLQVFPFWTPAPKYLILLGCCLASLECEVGLDYALALTVFSLLILHLSANDWDSVWDLVFILATFIASPLIFLIHCNYLVYRSIMEPTEVTHLSILFPMTEVVIFLYHVFSKHYMFIKLKMAIYCAVKKYVEYRMNDEIYLVQFLN